MLLGADLETATLSASDAQVELSAYVRDCLSNHVPGANLKTVAHIQRQVLSLGTEHALNIA